MMVNHQSEKGQALVLIAFAMVGMILLIGLAVDGGYTFADRRQSQNAADAAVLAAALDYAHGGNQWSAKALTIANLNGYDNDGSTNTVTFPTPVDVSGDCLSGQGKEFKVNILSKVKTSFSVIAGVDTISNQVSATSRVCLSSSGPLFNGSAVVGLSPTGYSFDSGNSNAARWQLTGGGIFANHDAKSKNSGSVTFSTAGTCISAVGNASGFGCSPVVQNNASIAYSYPVDIIPMIPPIPPCTGVATTDVDGKIHEQVGYENQGSLVDGMEHDYAPGVYCLQNIGGNLHGATTGSGVSLYIKDTSFTVKYNGGGYIAITAPITGPYAGVAMFSNLTSTPCSQNLEFRGNGTSLNRGTIFLPSACIDFRGNSNGNLQQTQVIGYQVTSNGTADVAIKFSAGDNFNLFLNSKLDLIK